jgi:large subunit ribosomal protein L20
LRVKGGTVTKQRHKKVLKKTKGMRDLRSKSIRRAKEAVLKAGSNAYRDRKRKKRDFRSLWNIRIGAAVKALGSSYSKFIGALKGNKVELDRKVLAEIATDHPQVFEKIVERTK